MVGIIDAQVEEDFARFDRMGQVDKRGCAPAAIAVKLGNESVISVWQPFKARKTMLHLHQLFGPAGERSGQCHHLIAMWHLRARIAAIESLGPDQTSVVERLPLHASRAGGHALAGDVVADRQVGDRGDRMPRGVPYLGLAREVQKRHPVRERAANRADQEILLVGRRADRGDQCGRSDTLDFAGLGIDPGELAGREVLE